MRDGMRRRDLDRGRRYMRRGVRRRIIAMLVCLVAMVAVMFSAASLFVWIRDRMAEAAAASGGDVVDGSEIGRAHV